MNRLRARIKDKRVCSLVKAFLESGILTELGERDLLGDVLTAPSVYADGRNAMSSRGGQAW
jgi:hypothetical protein